MNYEEYRQKQSCLLLVDGVGIEILIRRSVCAAILLQHRDGIEFRIKDPMDKISDAINLAIHNKYTPPSEAQINYAFIIADALDIILDDNIVSTKRSCHEFISNHVDEYRSRYETALEVKRNIRGCEPSG